MSMGPPSRKDIEEAIGGKGQARSLMEGDLIKGYGHIMPWIKGIVVGSIVLEESIASMEGTLMK
jgi:hypothetical protein